MMSLRWWILAVAALIGSAMKAQQSSIELVPVDSVEVMVDSLVLVDDYEFEPIEVPQELKAEAAAQITKPDPVVRFAWGASFVGELDMSGYDQSSVGMEGYFGMAVPGIQMLGLGVGVNVPVSNSQRRMPIFLIARSNFSTRPTLWFADLRCGVSVNDVGNEKWQTGEYVSVGAGFNLAHSKAFSSHLILAYTFYGRKDYDLQIDEDTAEHLLVPSLHMVTLRLGITF